MQRPPAVVTYRDRPGHLADAGGAYLVLPYGLLHTLNGDRQQHLVDILTALAAIDPRWAATTTYQVLPWTRIRPGDLSDEELTWHGITSDIDPSTGALDLALLRIAPTSATTPPGLSAILAESLSDGLTLPLPSVLPEGWTAQLVVGGTLAAGVELRILPPGQLEVHASASIDGQLQFTATRTPPAGQRVTILGLPGIATLDAASIGLTSGAAFHWDSGSSAARGAFVVGFAVNGGNRSVSGIGTAESIRWSDCWAMLAWLPSTRTSPMAVEINRRLNRALFTRVSPKAEQRAEAPQFRGASYLIVLR